MTGADRPLFARVPTGFVTFLLALLILTQRAWARLLAPDLWGEDGNVFLAQALTDGVRSLLTPMAGSYFTVERLLMMGALRLVPLPWVPATVCLASVVAFAAVMSTIASPRYAWLIPSESMRVMAACLCCLLPGLSEMLGNLCNLNWVLFCWLAFVGLKEPSLPITKMEIALSLLVSVSTGATILLVPLFVWRLLALARERKPRREWVPGAVHLAVLLVFGVGVLLVVPGARPRASAVPSALQVLRVWYDHAVRLVAFTPWIGDRLTFVVWEWQPDGLYRAVKIAFLMFVGWWGWSHRGEPRAQALLVFLAGVSLWTMLAIGTRPYAFAMLQDERGDAMYLGRYAFVTSFAGLIFWLGVLKPGSSSRGRLAPMTTVFLALNLVMPLHRFTIDRYGPERRWLATVDALERSIATGCPRSVTVRQYPDPWQFTYVSRRPTADCR